MCSPLAPFRRSLALTLTLLLSGLPALAAAEPPVPPARPATPIADSAARAAMQHYGRGHDDNDALKWTGFGLLVGGASLIAVGAVFDDEDCFHSELSYGDCDTARKAAFVGGGIMAGVGVGLLVMAAHDGHGGRRGRYPSVTMQRGRMVLQERIRF